MITLTLLHPLQDSPVQHWTFENEPVIRIGRADDNHVVLYSAVVSRHHVELRHGEKEWKVLSLGTNGTYLDGKRIAQVPIKDGSVIRLARSGPKIKIRVDIEQQTTTKSTAFPMSDPLTVVPLEDEELSTRPELNQSDERPST